MVCTFFGHRETPATIKQILRENVVQLIENENVDRFYVGNHGAFDRMVYAVLTELSEVYPISFFVVLAYLPSYEETDSEHTILPDGIESVPRRFAITYRNNWMLRRSDYVLGYVTHDAGSGAVVFLKRAEKLKKHVILLPTNGKDQFRIPF